MCYANEREKSSDEGGERERENGKKKERRGKKKKGRGRILARRMKSGND